MAACRLEAQLCVAAGGPSAAETAARALAIGEELIARARANDTQLGEFLHVCVVAGQIAWSLGDHAAALRRWQRAVEVARPRIEGSGNWRLLDPAARAFGLLGRAEESRALIERLTQFGCQPLGPWPDADGLAIPVREPSNQQGDLERPSALWPALFLL
jgi:hypothetical protein